MKVECRQCHTSLLFTRVAAKCADCHADIHRRQFGANCEQCHTVKGWQVALRSVREHQNRFPLLGAHAVLECGACHKSAAVGQFTGLRTECVACHFGDYQNAKSFDHKAAGLPTTCHNCHSMDSWFGAKFDHSATGFALDGAHARIECSACHVGGRYKGTPAACYSCHARDYTATQNPNHTAARFPTECSQCHTTATWSQARFDHNTFTRFALTGAHISATCQQCHVNGRYTGTPKDCASCHQADFNKTTNPNHRTAGFPTTCATCHSTASWSGAKFDHNTLTKFPLTGAHVNATCTQCHVNGQFAGTPKDCASCHLNDYTRTTNPNHVNAGFPKDCSVCHSTATWTGAKFDHSQTNFPLTGAHVNVVCATCHVGGKYTGLSTACVSCHLTNYNNTRNPNHAAAGFPQECAVCHTTTAWTPATFNHSTTRFPLTGAHVRVACASCHIGGKYAGTPMDCYSCHKQDFNATTNPNHTAAGFPTTCTTCHNTTTWTGAQFNHNKFPIYSGVHAGKWTTCADCHTNPSNFAVFNCLTCHAHDKTRMDQVHRNIRNYVYNSPNCYSCHPTGKAG